MTDGAAAVSVPATNNFGSNSSSLQRPSQNRDSVFKSNAAKVDPFRDYRYDDPFEMADRYGNVDDFSGNGDDVDRGAARIPRGASAPPLIDAFEASFWRSGGVGGGSFSSSSTMTTTAATATTTAASRSSINSGLSKSISSSEIALPSEDQQLAWATFDSVKTEKERRKRAEQEKADYKLAVKLSKAEGKKKSFRSKILS